MVISAADQSTRSAKTALLGGTFDPVHHGHLRLAMDLQVLGFDEVWLLPNAVPPHRAQPVASVHHRLTMLSIALPPEPGIKLETVECQGSYADQAHSRRIPLSGAAATTALVDVVASSASVPSYSLLTLERLRARDAQAGIVRHYTWILGSDALLGLDQWYRWREFVSKINVLVIQRSGYSSPAMGSVDEWWQQASVPEFSQLLNSEMGACCFVNLRRLDISATEVRTLLAQGRSPRYLISERVLAYISEHKLYIS